MTHDQLPDLTRPDADLVLVVETPGTEAVALPEPWPDGLISFSTFASTDGETTLTYTQWAAGSADEEFLGGLTGAAPVAYRLYRGQSRENPPVPGCIVVVSIEFDGPDQQRQRRWVDTVFEALASETEPHPGGISGHFHVSVDGTRALLYSGWTDEHAHRDALERSNQGAVGPSPAWRRVQQFPGIRDSGVRRYHLRRGLSGAHP